MSTVKNINIELGINYSITTVTTMNNDVVRVVSVSDEDGGCIWNAEAASCDEATEKFALALAQACANGVLGVIVGDDL
jgi:hypothetical protein